MGAVLMSLVAGLLGLVITYIAIRFTKFLLWHRQMVKAVSGVIGPKPHWLFGNVLQIGCFNDFLRRMHKEFVEDKHCKLFVFWFSMLRPHINLTHPDTIKVVMKSSAPKAKWGAGYLFMVPWIGDGLLVSDGPKWERNRKLLTPAFHFNILNNYFKVYNEVADTLLDKFAKGSKDGQYMEIYKAAGLATLDTLLQCSMSYKGNVQLVGENHPYVKAVKKLSNHVLARTMNLLYYNERIYRWSTSGREFFQLCDYVHKFSEEIIENRKEELSNKTSTEQVEGKRRLDFLDILLTAKDEENRGLTLEEIRSEVDTFMFAGHDTTCSALSWSIYSLGKYPDIQDKVFREVRNAMGDRQCIDGDDVAKMPYVSCFLKEVMRHYTTTPLVVRMSDHPMVIDDVEFPKGSSFGLNMFSVHHNPDVWDDPWEFKPERFEDDKHHEMDPYSFVPFSAGPRSCIGKAFALNEERVFIARILNRFEVTLDPNHEAEPIMEVVMRSKDGIMVNFKEREM